MTDTVSAQPVKSPPPTLDQPEPASVGTLVSDALADVSTLVRHEIELAKAEVKVTVRNGGIGAALFAVAGFLVVLAVIMLSVAIAYFLVMAGLDPAFAFLIVFGAYLVLAGLLAAVGISKVKKVGPPERAIAQAQETKKVLSNRG